MNTPPSNTHIHHMLGSRPADTAATQRQLFAIDPPTSTYSMILACCVAKLDSSNFTASSDLLLKWKNLALEGTLKPGMRNRQNVQKRL